MPRLHIGIDSTDSPRKGCTTYIAALLVEKLINLGIAFIDYPNIVRLNPNVPWKTRGNGAVCLRTEVKSRNLTDVKEVVIETVKENSDIGHPEADPGIVFFFGNIPRNITAFSERALSEVLTMKDAAVAMRGNEVETVTFKKGRGVIGALAAVGNELLGDYTFELIAYRRPEMWGTPRRIDSESVVKMNRETSPLTFNNIDLEKNRHLITPHGRDPILYGIRGESPEIVKRAHEMVRVLEEIERWVIFRTNHGTDSHLKRVKNLRSIKSYSSIVCEGVVIDCPKVIEGGHTIFKIENDGYEIECASYEPTGILSKIARELMPDDVVEVYGGVKPATPLHDWTINVEKIRVLKLKPVVVYKNPPCPRCGKSMKSLGVNKGFRCKKCGLHQRASKVPVLLPRNIRETLYIPSPRAHRHLTKPYSRYGREKLTVPAFKRLNPARFYWSPTALKLLS